jgi:hypothetical protein
MSLLVLLLCPVRLHVLLRLCEQWACTRNGRQTDKQNSIEPTCEVHTIHALYLAALDESYNITLRESELQKYCHGQECENKN